MGNLTTFRPTFPAVFPATFGPNDLSKRGGGGASRPRASIAAPAGITNQPASTFRVTWNEEVAGFVQGDITAVNGTVTGFTTITAGLVYDVTITTNLGGDGSYGLSIPADVCTSVATGLGNIQASGSILYDITPPTVTVSGPADAGYLPFGVTLTFDGPVTGLTLGGITVTNGTASDLQGSGAEYTATITASSLGTDVTVRVAADAATDDAGNGNTQSNLLTVTTQPAPTQPVPVISAPASSVSATFAISIAFDQEVIGLTAADFAVTNGSLSNLQTADLVDWTADVTADANGDVSVTLPADRCFGDYGGLGNVQSNTTITDVQADVPTNPTVTLTGPATSANKVIAVTITFDQAVSGLTAGDFTATNCSLDNLASGDNITWTMDLTATTPNQDSTIQLPADSCTGQFGGLGNEASNLLTTQWQAAAPTVSITGAATSANKVIPVTITFDQPVSGLAIGDFTVTNGALANLASGDDTTWTADLTATTPNQDSTVLLPADSCVSIDTGLGNQASNTFTTQWQAAAPTVSLAGGPTSSNKVIPFTITFDQPVTGLTAGDFAVTNCSIDNLATADSVSWTADATAVTVNQDLTVQLPADACTSTDTGLGNAQSNVLTMQWQGTAPTVSITGAATSANKVIPVTITFDQAVTGLTDGDFTVTNGTLSNLASGDDTTWTADLTATTPNQDSTVLLPADACTSVSSELGNQASNTFTTQWQAAAPTVSLAGGPTSSNKVIPITITFDQPVTGLTAGDFAVTNCSIDNLATSDSVSWTANATAGTINQDLTVQLPADACTSPDTGLGNAQSNLLTMQWQGTAPTVSITGAATSANKVIPITITFDQAITGLTDGDFTVTNGSLANLASGDDTTWTADLTATTPNQDSTVLLPADSCTSVSSELGNQASNTFTTQWQATAPTVAWSGLPADHDGIAAFNGTITFSEDVTGFLAGDIAVANATVTGLTGGPAVYTATITPSGAQDTITLQVPADAATSTATGLGNQAGVVESVPFSGGGAFNPDSISQDLLSWMLDDASTDPVYEQSGGAVVVRHKRSSTAGDARPLQPGRCYIGDGAAWISVPAIVGNETPTWDGDATVSLSAGRIDISSGGSAWNINIPGIGTYHCDEGSGTTSYDSSGTANHGSIQSIHAGFHGITGDAYSWQNEVGYTDNSGVLVPRNEAIPTQDVLGGQLQYIGRAPIDGHLNGMPCLNFDGTAYISLPHLAGSETITSYQGTSTPSITAGRIDCTVGTLFNVLLSDGTFLPCGEGGGRDIFDVSGNNNHGMLGNFNHNTIWGTQNQFEHNQSFGFNVWSDVSFTTTGGLLNSWSFGPSSAWRIEMTVYMTGNSLQSDFFGWTSGTGSARYNGSAIQTTGECRLIYANSQYIHPRAVLQAGNVYNIVWGRDPGTELFIIVNGDKESFSDNGGGSQVNATLPIGHMTNHTNTSDLRGRASSYILTAKFYKSADQSNLFASYDTLTDASQTEWIDNSGNGRDAVFNPAAASAPRRFFCPSADGVNDQLGEPLEFAPGALLLPDGSTIDSTQGLGTDLPWSSQAAGGPWPTAYAAGDPLAGDDRFVGDLGSTSQKLLLYRGDVTAQEATDAQQYADA